MARGNERTPWHAAIHLVKPAGKRTHRESFSLDEERQELFSAICEELKRLDQQPSEPARLACEDLLRHLARTSPASEHLTIENADLCAAS